MTACVNRKHTKKVAAVVTASLVGALSLGVAPVAAVADTGIETLAAEWFTGATVTKAHDGNSGTVSNPNQATFAEGTAKYLVPTEVTNTFGDATDVDTADYTVTYYIKSGSGYSAVAGDNATETAETYFSHKDASGKYDNTKGTYYVVVADATDPSKCTDYIPFKYVGKEALETITADALVYTGADLSSKFEFKTADGDVIEPDSTPTFTDGNGNGVTPVNAGSYVASFTYGGAAYNVKVTVSQLDLSAATLYCDDIVLLSTNTDSALQSAFMSTLKINGSALTGASTIKVTSVTAPDGSAGWGTTPETGQYTVTVAEDTDAANNIKGSGSVTFSYLNKSLFLTEGYDVNYGRNLANGQNIYLTDGESFDASKISVTDGNTSYAGDQIEVTYEKQQTSSTGAVTYKSVDVSELSKPGTYRLNVRVKPFQTFAEDEWLGGTKQVFINIKGATIDSNTDLAFYVDGELAGNTADGKFDGHDWLEDITAVVKDSEGNTYEQGTDFTLEVKNSDGDVVDSIVDVDIYKIQIKPITFEFTNAATDTLTFEVTKITVDRIVADVANMKYAANESNGEIPAQMPVLDENGDPVKDSAGNTVMDDNEFYVNYTGDTIALPGIKFQVETGTAPNIDYSYVALPSDVYNVVSIENEDGKKVEEIVEPGTYEVKITLNDNAKSNFTFSSTAGADTFTVTVKEFGHFTDVDSTKWYAVPVEKAYELGYVNGISGTNLFAPEADITRADAVCILFNMAGGFNLPDDDFSFDVDHGYNTGFSDVDGHDYFAKALAWARAFGVANGYGDGTFKPYAQITREEFASMLANYAKAMGKFETASDGALDGMSDANTVSDWAEANVAWAVENGVMGNGGFVAGQSNITRAEVAAMAVNYQPEAL